MANLFLHEAVPRMMLNLITVGIRVKLKVLLIVMSYSFLEPPVSFKVDKLFMHFSCILYWSKAVKKLLRIKYWWLTKYGDIYFTGASWCLTPVWLMLWCNIAVFSQAQRQQNDICDYRNQSTDDESNCPVREQKQTINSTKTCWSSKREYSGASTYESP